jgi:hypothetical protein
VDVFAAGHPSVALRTGFSEVKWFIHLRSFAPQKAIFLEDKLPWVTIDKSLPFVRENAEDCITMSGHEFPERLTTELKLARLPTRSPLPLRLYLLSR